MAPLFLSLLDMTNSFRRILGGFSPGIRQYIGSNLLSADITVHDELVTRDPHINEHVRQKLLRNIFTHPRAQQATSVDIEEDDREFRMKRVTATVAVFSAEELEDFILIIAQDALRHPGQWRGRRPMRAFTRQQTLMHQQIHQDFERTIMFGSPTVGHAEDRKRDVVDGVSYIETLHRKLMQDPTPMFPPGALVPLLKAESSRKRKFPYTQNMNRNSWIEYLTSKIKNYTL